MTKEIKTAIGYAVNMINVMVEHDKAGAMKKWVDGIVNSWIVRILESIEDRSGDSTGIENLSEDAQKLIIRAIVGIARPENRSIVLSTCIHHGIIPIFLIPIEELNNVSIIGLD